MPRGLLDLWRVRHCAMREMTADVDLLVDLDQQLGNLDPSHLGIRLAASSSTPSGISASSGVMRTLFCRYAHRAGHCP